MYLLPLKTCFIYSFPEFSQTCSHNSLVCFGGLHCFSLHTELQLSYETPKQSGSKSLPSLRTCLFIEQQHKAPD